MEAGSSVVEKPVSVLDKIIFGVLAFAGFFSLYLALHHFTPFADLEIAIIDITQVSRAGHVFLLMLAGYLVYSTRPVLKTTPGAWFLLALMVVLLYRFLELDSTKLDMPSRAFGVLCWIVAVGPIAFPQFRRGADLVAAVLAAAPFIYMAVGFEQIVYRAIIPASWDLAMSFGLGSLVVGITYRLLGPVMPNIMLFFFLYTLFGDKIPGAFHNVNQPMDVLLGKLYNETENGYYGLLTGVSMKYLVYFTVLGGVINYLGLANVIAKLSMALVGRSPQTPGRATSIASVFMGMFSGSGAADTQFVATISKPMFDQSGYEKNTAAGLVATAGSIALITPPVLGSIAFIMVEILRIPYLNIVVMSIGPMLMYLTAIWFFNEFYSRKMKLKPAGEIIPKSYIRRYAHIFLPILLIVFFLYRGFEVNVAVVLAIVGFIVLCYADPTLRPKSPKAVVQGVAAGFESLLPIGNAILAAGMIFTMMVTSGLASKFSGFLLDVSGDSLFLATIIAALFSLILGMGIPPTATYVLSSALTAPAIIALAVKNGIPEEAAILATHMFLFYYAVMADVTPPVALSAYAAASVFGTNPLTTGVAAARVALSKYILGFFFLLSYQGTALLILPVWQHSPPGEALFLIISRLILVVLGLIFLASATVGYTRRDLSRPEAWVLGIIAIVAFYPSFYVGLVGVALGALFFWYTRPQSRAAV